MKITINRELEGQEILNALFSENGKFLLKLKKKLDELMTSVADKKIPSLLAMPYPTDKEFDDLLAMFPEDKPSSDTKAPLPPKETLKSTKTKPKRKYNLKHKHNVITNKTFTCAKCHKEFKPKGNRQQFCSTECGMKQKVNVINQDKFEKEPPIIPAKRPNSTGIFMDT